MELRRQMQATGVAPPSFGRPDDHAFAGEIQRLGAERPIPQPSPDRWGPPSMTPAPSSQSHPTGRKLLLRETAFQLDTLAHRLEMQDLCAQADELRTVANRLRAEARAPLGPPQKTTPALNGASGFNIPANMPANMPPTHPGRPNSRRSTEPPPTRPLPTGPMHFPSGRLGTNKLDAQPAPSSESQESSPTGFLRDNTPIQDAAHQPDSKHDEHH